MLKLQYLIIRIISFFIVFGIFHEVFDLNFVDCSSRNMHKEQCILIWMICQFAMELIFPTLFL